MWLWMPRQPKSTYCLLLAPSLPPFPPYKHGSAKLKNSSMSSHLLPPQGREREKDAKPKSGPACDSLGSVVRLQQYTTIYTNLIYATTTTLLAHHTAHHPTHHTHSVKAATYTPYRK